LIIVLSARVAYINRRFYMEDGIAEKFAEVIERLKKVRECMDETNKRLKTMLEDKKTRPITPAE
jgi:hypothetical protein